jgi:hypothetical protein
MDKYINAFVNYGKKGKSVYLEYTVFKREKNLLTKVSEAPINR